MKTLGILLTLSWFYNWKHSRKCFVGLYRDIYTLRFKQWKFIKKVHLFLYITSGIGMLNAMCRENRLHFLSIFIYLFHWWHVSNHFNPDTLRFKTTVYCLLLWIRISSRGRLINTCCFFSSAKAEGFNCIRPYPASDRFVFCYFFSYFFQIARHPSPRSREFTDCLSPSDLITPTVGCCHGFQKLFIKPFSAIARSPRRLVNATDDMLTIYLRGVRSLFKQWAKTTNEK